MFFLSITLLFFDDLQKVTIQPFDFQVESKPETYVRGMWALYHADGFLFFIPKDDPYVYRIDPKTKAIKKIGGKGSGPGELGNDSPWALSPQGSNLWALDAHRGRASFFIDGEFQTSFNLKEYQVAGSWQPKFGFAHNDLYVIIPAYPASRHLANVYDYAGNLLLQMGDILPIEADYLAWNPALNDTIWQHNKGKWYCLFVHRPILRIFDRQFQLEKEFTLIGPEIDLHEETFHKKAEDPMVKAVLPHFTDFQITANHIYVMCSGVLYQLDFSGNTLARIGFYGNQEVEDDVGYRPRVHFEHAVVLEGGRVFLGAQGVDYYGHDLWYADIPTQSTTTPRQ